MSTHKHFDTICCVVLALTLLLTLLFVNAEHFGVQKASTVMGYEKTLFDTSRVHTINILMENWDAFTANCKSEEYAHCTVVIDNESYPNVAIRGKGNTSLSQVNNDRYSYKIEFDHYDSTNTYYGLDKLCLNNIIQDNTYMKDYLTYQMMRENGVASPLCSYAYITVNGEDWGLYLAVEGVEEAFLQRNYGNDYGELYKPDSMSMGGGRGNGERFDMEAFLQDSESDSTDDHSSQGDDQTQSNDRFTQKSNGNQSGNAKQPMPGGMGGQMPGGIQGGFDGGQMPGGMTPPTDSAHTPSDKGTQGGMTPPEGLELPDGMQGNMPGSMQNGNRDVLLQYIDEDIDSYANIFENAKTAVKDSDKTRLIQALKKLSNGVDLENTVDIDAVIRYFVVHNFVLNFDSYTGSMVHNYYLYEKDGQMQMIPWDYNLAFGGFQSMSDATTLVNYPIDSPVSGGNVEDRPMLAWIFETEEYTERYHQYFAAFISEYFDSGYFTERIDRIHAMISPYVEKDPTKFCTYAEFQTGIATLREFCLLRAESVNGQLEGTIGSTADTQTSDTLIEAGDIQISRMGSMGSMGGGKDPLNGNAQEAPTDSNHHPMTDSTEESSSEDADIVKNNGSEDQTTPPTSDGIQQGGSDGGQIPGGTPPDFSNGENGEQGGFGGQLQRPDNNSQLQAQGEDTLSSSHWMMMGVSILVLAGGLAFAFLFKRRR